MKFPLLQLSKYWILGLSFALFAFSCSNDKFRIKGEIYGAQDKTLVLEKPDFQGRWIPVDSIRINKNGAFSLAFPALPAPEIFRLSLNNQFIYFPVDSTETITLTSSFDKFGTDFSLTGSNTAQNLEKFEKDLHKIRSLSPDSMESFKRMVYTNYMKDFPGSILGFYILTKTIDGNPLYNPANPSDRKYFTAVANGYKTVRPDDPHTALMEQVALRAIKEKNKELGNYRTLEADELTLIEIDLPDETGKNVKLSDIAGKGKPVLVVFSLMNAQESPEFNIRLANIYNRLAGKVEFYNVSLDADQYDWREAARNLPWITVYSPGQSSSEDALHYNVYQLPSFFIYNSDGELISRPLTLDEVNKSF